MTILKLFVALLFAATLSVQTVHAATFNVTVGAFGGLAGFVPSSVTIHPGDQVKWTWASDHHSTTSINGLWDSGLRNRGATFTHTFNSAGTFKYYCRIDREVGKVIVMSATPTPTPSPTPTPPPPGTATVADFNGDGHPDFVVHNAATHQTVVAYFNDTVFLGAAFGPTLPAG